jgi:hypothetical protein
MEEKEHFLIVIVSDFRYSISDLRFAIIVKKGEKISYIGKYFI